MNFRLPPFSLSFLPNKWIFNPFNLLNQNKIQIHQKYSLTEAIEGGHVAGVGVGADDAFEREGGLGARRVHSKTLGQKITKGLS